MKKKWIILSSIALAILVLVTAFILSPNFEVLGVRWKTSTKKTTAVSLYKTAITDHQSVQAALDQMANSGEPVYLQVGPTSWPNVYTGKATTFKVDTSKVDTLRVSVINGLPVKQNRILLKQRLFLEAAVVCNGQTFLIVTLPDVNGIKIANSHLAVLYDDCRYFSTKQEVEDLLNREQAERLTQAGIRASLNPGQATQSVTIPCNQLWTNTGVTVPDSCLITIRMSGSFLNKGYGNTVTPEGVGGCGFDTGNPRICNDSPLAAFGWVGNGSPPVVTPGQSSNAFRIGLEKSLTIFRGGQLFIGCNDDVQKDNQGSWPAQITVTPLASS